MDGLARVLQSHNIKTKSKPMTKIKHMLISAKVICDPLFLAQNLQDLIHVQDNLHRHYRTRVKKEHCMCCRFIRLKKSGIADEALDNLKCKIFDDTEVLSIVTSCYSRLYCKTIEIAKHSNSFNRQEVLTNYFQEDQIAPVYKPCLQ